MVVFGLFIFLAVLMIGGMAVDIMRYEEQRVHLQNTADRAALAAGSLRQPNDPASVVEEYFRREGLETNLTSVTVNEGLNFREVNIQTAAIVPTFFMRLVGIDTLPMQPVSTAEERYSKVEVSLVLDLSNSMNSFNRIDNLRDAGVEFIDTLYENAEEGQVSVSVVNYTGQVNPGADLLSHYTVSQRQPFSHCVEFGASDYQTMSLSTSAPLVGAGHFDPWHTSRARNMIFCPTPRFSQWSASDDSHRENVVLSGDPEFLSDYLGNLWADGNTSIEIGLKWGAAMLDPGTRPIVEAMVAAGEVMEEFDGRPLDYDDEEALKVVVLMTDGENFEQWMIDDAYKTGQSDVWHTVFFDATPGLQAEVDGLIAGTIMPHGLQMHRFDAVAASNTRPSRNPSSSNRIYLSIRPNNTGDWYLPSPTTANPGNSGNWRNAPWTTGSLPNSTTAATSCQFHSAASTGLEFDLYRCNDRVAYRMTYPWLWDNFSVRWVARHLYHNTSPRIMTESNFINATLGKRSANVKNQHLATMCSTIRAEGVLIFAVAFEAPPGGVTAMRNCATSAAHFFDVAGTDIRTAFRAIAGTINRLRLTQ
jgi:hypothetical protein